MKFFALAWFVLTIASGIVTMMAYTAKSGVWIFYALISALSLGILMYLYQLIITKEMDENLKLR